MYQRDIANTGIQVSIVGLGTVKFGRNEGVKYPQAFTLPSDREIKMLLSSARDSGINLIDTAPAYGTSEARLGALLSHVAQRRDWVICTKVGEEFSQGHSRYHFTPEHTAASIERSLKRLNTDYLDIVLVHSNGDDSTIIEHSGVLETLADLKQKGIIRALGVSTKTVAGGLLAAKKSDVVMVTYNLEDQSETPVLSYCAEHNKGVFIKKALASGHLDPGQTDPVQASLNVIFQQPGVTSVILGTINPAHLRHNVQAALQAVQ